MLFATCSYSLFGQSSFYHRMETAIDLGVCDSTYYYEGTLNTGDYSNDYVLPSYKEPDFSFGNEIFFKLTLTRSMDVGIGINGPSEVGTFAHILDVTGKEVDRLNLGYADLCISLLPGTYLIHNSPLPRMYFTRCSSYISYVCIISTNQPLKKIMLLYK